MRPVALEIQAFRGWRERVELKLDAPITALIAPNKAGKSSTLNAIEWCLFGDVISGKASSGIGERAAWEIYPRDGASGPTEVRLVLRTPGGDAVVTRTAPADGDKKGAGTFEVQIPGGSRVSGTQAESWLRENGLPDWETYRRAHCFHQESARTRVIDSKDRSHILAALLGLDDDMRVRDAVEGRTGANLVKQIDEQLGDLERHVTSVLGRPQKTMMEIEAQLATKGLDRTQVHESKALQVRRSLLARAAELAANLGIDAGLPDAEDGPVVTRWARDWPAMARAGAPTLAPLELQRRQVAALKAAIPAVEAVDTRWTEADRQLDIAKTQDGDRVTRAERVRLAKARVSAADEAVQRANRRVALLNNALNVLKAETGSEQCPVCDTGVPGLSSRIEREIGLMSSEEIRTLMTAKEEAEKAERQAHQSVRSYELLETARQDASRYRDDARAKLATQLGVDATGAAHDVLAAARKRLEVLEQSNQTLERLASERDQSLAEHADEAELLSKLDSWLDAARRANSQLDFESLPQWALLNATIDEGAGFAADLEAIAEMARDAQAERSRQREADVNRAFGKYYRMIVGDGGAGDVVVKTKQSGKGLGYELVDDADRQAVPVLNQASINALSLALLFAQAEGQVRNGGFACVVLDDPVQSLDPERQKGLAEALEELSKTCEVVLAVTTQSPILERLEKYVSVARVFQHLEPYDSKGSRLGERRAL
jgi:DNA repair exonuclease SbcCD ATPase subunit